MQDTPHMHITESIRGIAGSQTLARRFPQEARWNYGTPTKIIRETDRGEAAQVTTDHTQLGVCCRWHVEEKKPKRVQCSSDKAY